MVTAQLLFGQKFLAPYCQMTEHIFIEQLDSTKQGVGGFDVHLKEYNENTFFEPIKGCFLGF